MITLQIDGVAIPHYAALELEQEYEIVGGQSLFRAADGTGIPQETWGKLRVSTRGTGWMPAALAALDTSVSHVLRCIKPRAIPTSGLTATLPAARRSDSGAEPYGLALLADGSAVRTAASLAGNVATLTAVAGAVAYQACYFPQITAWLQRPTDALSRNGGDYSWSLVAEEL